MKYHHFFQLWFAVVALMVCTVAGCQTSAPQTKDAEGRTLVTISCESPRKRAGYGPPPFEYWRIIGGTVPKAGFALESALDAPGPMLWTFVGPRPVTSECWWASCVNRMPSDERRACVHRYCIRWCVEDRRLWRKLDTAHGCDAQLEYRCCPNRSKFSRDDLCRHWRVCFGITRRRSLSISRWRIDMVDARIIINSG